MSIIRIFNSAVPGEREIGVNEVNVVSMKMDYDGAPYMLFEHEDFPLGALKAKFNGSNWECDLN
jgi:hypothetical protein